MKILIVTPMQEELRFIVKRFTKQGFQAENAMAGKLPIVRIPELGITLGRGGTGKAQFALQTQHLLDSCVDRHLVICAGAAGGLVDGLAIGDVVVATTTVEHDYNNKFSNRPVPRFDGAPSTISRLKAVPLSNNSFKVHFGTVASGDEDVVDTERRRTLHQSTNALAVAWEGAGGARAARFSNVPFVEIRGVTDTADHDAPSDFKKNLETAMRNVATFIMSWITDVEQR